MLLNLLLAEGPIETTNYMLAGYTVIFGVMGLYLLSMYLRRRNLLRDLELLEELENKPK
jgi:hypothetical protein